MQVTGYVGQTATASDGGQPIVRLGRQSDLIGSDLHGRFYEQTLRGNTFSDGMVLTSISNAIWTVATTDATAKPITGLWNPANSGYNAVILQAHVNAIVTAATCTGCGGFTWMTATTQSAISTGTTPLSRLTLLGAGSRMKGMSGIASTGISGVWVARQGSSIACGSAANFSFVGTAVGQVTANVSGVENFDGSIIVPPGGMLGLFANTTPVAHSAVSGILWEEVPV